MTTSFLFQGKAGRLAATSAAALIGGIVGLAAAAPAAAVPAPAPRLVMGNVTTCAAAGLSGTILFGDEQGPKPPQPSGTGTVTQPFLDVTINAGWTASGVVVKGGPNANVYDGPFVGQITIDDMTAPINPNNNKPFDISHWFVCGGPSNGTPTPTPSGGAETGGGGSIGSGVSFMGVSALAIAGGMGAFLFIRRRRDAGA